MVRSSQEESVAYAQTVRCTDSHSGTKLTAEGFYSGTGRQHNEGGREICRDIVGSRRNKGLPSQVKEQNLSVLHITAFDNLGGSGRSAYRIHLGLKRAGIKTRMLVRWEITKDIDVGLISGNTGIKFLDRVFRRITGCIGLQDIFFPSSFLIRRHPWWKEANILQLYNTHGGYFSYTVLPFISKSRPVVWRLSDMWPMTGHCAYSYDCKAWETGCGSCPRLEEKPPLKRDTTRLLWHLKRCVYENSRFAVVAPSKWIAKLAGESPLLSRFPLYWIPNSVDTSVFKPIPRKTARRLLNIPINSNVIFLAAVVLNDPRKGGPLLEKALKKVTLKSSSSRDIFIVFAGGDQQKCGIANLWPQRYLGHVINDDYKLALAYAAADVFVLPTQADNLPNVILESMACGTPVVSFNVGGISEVVQHMVTGYLATPGDSNDLANGMRMLLNNENIAEMRRQCRAKIESEYSLERETQRFVELYTEILDRWSN